VDCESVVFNVSDNETEENTYPRPSCVSECCSVASGGSVTFVETETGLNNPDCTEKPFCVLGCCSVSQTLRLFRLVFLTGAVVQLAVDFKNRSAYFACRSYGERQVNILLRTHRLHRTAGLSIIVRRRRNPHRSGRRQANLSQNT